MPVIDNKQKAEICSTTCKSACMTQISTSERGTMTNTVKKTTRSNTSRLNTLNRFKNEGKVPEPVVADKPEPDVLTRRHYLVDTENISDCWVDLLDIMQPQDGITVFYTDKSAHIRCAQVKKLMEKGAGKITWIHCYEGNNALDFQLVTELGAMTAHRAASEYVIFSKDTGFDAVVLYWKAKGVTVTRIRNVEDSACRSETKQEPADPAAIVKPQPEPAPKAPKTTANTRTASSAAPVSVIPPEQEPTGPLPDPFPLHTEPAATESATTAPVYFDALPETDRLFVETLCKSISINRTALLHDALALFYPQNEGDRIYYVLKEDTGCHALLRNSVLDNKQKRVCHYLGLALEQAGFDRTDLRTLYGLFAESSIQNLKRLNTKLLEVFGQELGTKYYRILRRHYKVMKKIR